MNRTSFGDRFPAMAVALLVELPAVLVLVTSKSICQMIGKDDYKVWVGFLFVSCALSGNNGLFVSQVRTVPTGTIRASPLSSSSSLLPSDRNHSFLQHLSTELLTTAYLAAVIGFVVAAIVFCVTSFSAPLALAIAFGQSTSMLVSAFIGVFLPCVLERLHSGDSSRWSLQLVPTVQDLVTIASMAWVSLTLISWFYAPPAGQTNVC